MLDGCTVCQAQESNKAKKTITPIISKHVLNRVYLDLVDFTSEPDHDTGAKWMLQIKDHFSRMIWLYPLMDKSSAKIAKAVSYWLSWNGEPTCFYHNNGPKFKGEFEVLLRERDIKHIPGRAYHPQTQGSVEKANGIFKQRLAAVRAERGDVYNWVRFLPILQETINLMPCRMLPRYTTPFEVWFGASLITWPLLPRSRLD